MLVRAFRALISNYVSLQGLDCFYSRDALEILLLKVAALRWLCEYKPVEEIVDAVTTRWY